MNLTPNDPEFRTRVIQRATGFFEILLDKHAPNLKAFDDATSRELTTLCLEWALSLELNYLTAFMEAGRHFTPRNEKLSQEKSYKET